MLANRLKAATATASAPLAAKYFVIATHATSPFITAYEWDKDTGWGAKIADPSTLPPSTAIGLETNSTQQTGTTSHLADIVFVAHGSSPFISAYHFSRSGWGTKVANPATLIGSTGYAVSFHPTGQAVAVTTGSTPYLHAYAWNNTTKAWGTKYANPSAGLNGLTNDVHFKPTSTAASGHVAACMGNSPRILVWPFTISGGFGTKVGNPSSVPNSTMNKVRFQFNGGKIAGVTQTTPYIFVYPFTTSFGTVLANPATANRPNGTGNAVAFRPGDTALLIGHVSSPYMTCYAWSTSTSSYPTKIAAPASPINGNAFDLQFSAGEDGGNRIIVGYAAVPRVAAFKYGDPTPNTFGTKFANPATNLANQARRVRFIKTA
jgi:hypothetical protein